ncbi:hypothetical protein [Weissella confusa]|uniref:hypothetical protein n=1 Tax=Weissella confusa TaxID=1583 RepID=UPI001080A836|nr:hypothetical protein [Weissella confusa]TGE53004.1 hypothetical protein C6P18_02720 [Weissella confusa]TGE59927.1 hypothetical protein C6P19_02855 [Weissella confusa]
MASIYSEDSFIKKNAISIFSTLIALAALLIPLFSNYTYYKTSETITNAAMYSLLEKVDNQIDSVNTFSSDKEENKILMESGLSSISDSVNTIKSIDKSRLPRSKILIVMTTQSKVSAGLNVVNKISKSNNFGLGNDNNKNMMLSALYAYRKILKDQINNLESGRQPDVSNMKKSDSNFTNTYYEQIKQYRGE